MPSQRALKNVHGALFTDLTPVQKKKQEAMHYGITIPPTREMRFEQKHPLLVSALRQLNEQPKGFPFWYKKYPTRRHAYVHRFSIPSEMLEGYSDNIKKALSYEMMSNQEKQAAEEAMYMERYAEHDFDTTSDAVLAVKRALKVRRMRNHLLTNPHNNICKMILGFTEHSLKCALRRLRKRDFKKYW
uniref:28S ribosomal protein S15, mitochondrial n=1 Tax=Lygus hesperus TaxID=30085 RepID=A0A0A9XUR3_LYGHE